jgi:hypothetical protein
VSVVPVSVPVDFTHFHALVDACAAAGANGLVTIEPGSTPDASYVNVGQPGLTIRGDAIKSERNQPDMNGYLIDVNADSVSLVNLNLSDVRLVNGSSHTMISQCYLHRLTQYSTGSKGNGEETITQNNIGYGGVTLIGPDNPTQPVNDVLSYNTVFPDQDQIELEHTMVNISNSPGTIVESNHFSGLTRRGAYIHVSSTALATAPLVISNNVIDLSEGAEGIVIDGSVANVLNNSIGTLSTGLDISASGNEVVMVQGNDFHNNAIGVAIHSQSSAPNLVVDLGGGPLGCLGGNNFRGFTARGTDASAAIYLSVPATGLAPAGVSAKGNIFSPTVDPGTVVDDSSHGSQTGSGAVDVSGPLTGEEAFVQTLYNNLLGRTGSSAELMPWASMVRSRGQAIVVNEILHSNESLTRIVDHQYIQFLGRVPGAAESAAWVGFLSAGGTLEQFQDLILTSPEYLGKTIPNWVRSLYFNVLDRPGSEGEIVAWNNAATSLGLSGIARAFTDSFEARYAAATLDYEAFLHREPSVSEAAAFATSPADFLAMEMIVLSSVEYYGNG